MFRVTKPNKWRFPLYDRGMRLSAINRPGETIYIQGVDTW